MIVLLSAHFGQFLLISQVVVYISLHEENLPCDLFQTKSMSQGITKK